MCVLGDGGGIKQYWYLNMFCWLFSNLLHLRTKPVCSMALQTKNLNSSLPCPCWEPRTIKGCLFQACWSRSEYSFAYVANCQEYPPKKIFFFFAFPVLFDFICSQSSLNKTKQKLRMTRRVNQAFTCNVMNCASPWYDFRWLIERYIARLILSFKTRNVNSTRKPSAPHTYTQNKPKKKNLAEVSCTLWNSTALSLKKIPLSALGQTSRAAQLSFKWGGSVFACPHHYVRRPKEWLRKRPWGEWKVLCAFLLTRPASPG